MSGFPVARDEVAIYEYDAFGNVITEAGSLANEFRFSTKQADKRGELIDFGFRWHDPEIGRWIQRDPLGLAGGLNLYAYCDSNPVNLIDCWGLDPLQFTPSALPGAGGGPQRDLQNCTSPGMTQPEILKRAPQILREARSSRQIGGTVAQAVDVAINMLQRNKVVFRELEIGVASQYCEGLFSSWIEINKNWVGAGDPYAVAQKLVHEAGHAVRANHISNLYDDLMGGRNTATQEALIRMDEIEFYDEFVKGHTSLTALQLYIADDIKSLNEGGLSQLIEDLHIYEEYPLW